MSLEVTMMHGALGLRYRLLVGLLLAMGSVAPTVAGTIDAASFCTDGQSLNIEFQVTSTNPSSERLAPRVALDDSYIGGTTERVLVNFSSDTGTILFGEPEVVPDAGAPDRLVDGTITNYAVTNAGTRSWLFEATIPNGAQPLVAGDTVVEVWLREIESGATSLTTIEGPYTVESCAVAAEPMLVLDLTSIDFGSVTVGDTSAPTAVTVSNTGTADLDVASITVAAAPFASAGGSCGSAPFTLAAGASCTLEYTFSPAAAGAAQQSIDISSNAASSPDTLTLLGTGEEVAAPPAPSVPIPVDARWALLLMVLLMGSIGLVQLRRW